MGFHVRPSRGALAEKRSPAGVSAHDGLFDHLQQAIVLDFNDSPQMRTTFESLVGEYRDTGAASHAMMTALMNQCLILVLRRMSDEAEGSLPWLSALEDPQLAGVIDEMLEHPEQHHTVESFAGAQLLRCGDLSIDEVASKVGFSSRSHFSHTFRDHFGASPLAFREGPAPSS